MAAAQPVGFAAGVKAAEERISAVRSAHNIPPEQTVLAVENFLVEIGENKYALHFCTIIFVSNLFLQCMTLIFLTSTGGLMLESYF